MTKLEGRQGSETTFTGKDDENIVFWNDVWFQVIFTSKEMSTYVKNEVSDMRGEKSHWINNVLHKSLMFREEKKVADDGILEGEHVIV